MHNHYDRLKVQHDAPGEVIRAAYRALSQRYHPDKNPEDASSAEFMSLLNEAYAVLSDPARRAAYDSLIRTHVREPKVDIADEAVEVQRGPAEIESLGTDNKHRPPPSPKRLVVGLLLMAVAAISVIAYRQFLFPKAHYPETDAQPTTMSSLRPSERNASIAGRWEGWDGPDGAWQTVMNVGQAARGYKVTLEVRGPGCIGSIEGAATLSGTTLTLTSNDALAERVCTVTADIEGTSARMSYDQCSDYHGAACDFGATLTQNL